jgi:hypothetical protein
MHSTTTGRGNTYRGGSDTGYLIFDARIATSEANRRYLEGMTPVAGDPHPTLDPRLLGAQHSEVEVRVPWGDLVELVMDHLRSEAISALEQASTGRLVKYFTRQG